MILIRSMTCQFILTGVLLLFLGTSGLARPAKPVSQKLNKTTAATQSTRTISNIGNWTYWMLWDGQGASDPITGSFGGLFPRGTVSTIFRDGLLWGGIVDDPSSEFQLRVGGSEFISGVSPGYIDENGRRVNADQDSRIRIYRIRSDWETLTPAQVRRDAAELNGVAENAVTDAQIQDVLDQYRADWEEWPIELGAPFNDLNGNGIYEPDQGETPGIANADQVVWMVANDLDFSRTNGLFGSPPIGLEYQITAWAYSQPGARLGQIIFKKYTLVNRSRFTIRDMYVGQWADPDLGSFGDDVVGNDSLLSLGFVYNGSHSDPQYDQLGIATPAAGYDFFQGPLVRGVAGQDLNKNGIDDAEDTGIFNLQRTEPGFINLPMTSFVYFAAGDPNVSDPPNGDYNGTRGWYNLLRGFLPTFDVDNPTPYRHGSGPLAGRASRFPLNGNPVTGLGDIDGQGNNLAPADRRMVLNTGPFVMEPGDKQEIVVALMGAIGDDQIKSVEELKETDMVAQTLYDDLFATVPKPPVAPKVEAIPFEKRIVLNWGLDAAAIAATEFDNPQTGYNFEGYNVYQLPNPNATLREAKRVATFDKVNGVTTILGKRLVAETGRIEVVAVQQGTDSGIQRFITIDRNAITGDELHPGTPYYFAVTAYNFNDFSTTTPLIEDSTLESGPVILEVIPQAPRPGVRYPTTAGEVLSVSNGKVLHTAGKSDGIVEVTVVDPSRTKNREYQIAFQETEDGVTWNLLADGQVLLENQQQLAPTELNNFDRAIVDGLIVNVAGPPPGMNPGGQGTGWDIPSGARRFTWANADGFAWEGFNGAIGWGSPGGPNGFATGGFDEPVRPDGLKPVLLKLASVPDGAVTREPVFDRNDENVSYGYRYGRNFTAAPEQPEFAPFMINTTDGGYRFQDFEKSVPLSAWDVSDPDNPRRLAIGFLENNGADAVLDGVYFPRNSDDGVSNTAGSGPREWLFIYDADYSETPDPAFQGDMLADPIPVMYWLTVNRRGSDVPFSPNATGEDQFLIFPNNPNTASDAFAFQTVAPTFDQAVARDDLEKINVFPNPYYAFNPTEVNRFDRHITFSHLPRRATLRIFNLAGVQVRKLEKDSDSQFLRWNLLNESNLPVASGIYLVHIDMPDMDATRVLKVYIIQREEIIQFF